MSNEKPFFMRDPWVYDPQADRPERDDDHLGFDTRALHSGFHPLQDPKTFRSFVPPITQSMTYPYETFDKIPCPVYGRTRTPINSLLEERLAALEGGQACITAGSGSQALFNLIFTIARPGDNVVTSLNVFGEGYKQAATIFPQRCQVEFRFVQNPEDLQSWETLIDRQTKLVWVETPSNPCLFITDIAGLANVAHSHGVPLMVDNTTATAALQKPIRLGADIILLSITKFLGGNATVIGGAVIAEENLVEDIRWNTTEFVGSVMPPLEAWMTLQYIETLSNPQHELAQRQMKAHGGLLSFVASGGIQGVAKVMNALKLIVHAVTFGTSRTICMHPATITHEHMTPEERATAGIDDGLIRLSVGLENPKDIIDDLDQALAGL
jgi:cystathionine beta-lyase/cystathionine gamma-synthase